MPTWGAGCAFPEDVLPVASKELVLCLGLYSVSCVPVRVTAASAALDEGTCQVNLLVLWMNLAAWSPRGIAVCCFWGVSGGVLPPCLVPPGSCEMVLGGGSGRGSGLLFPRASP